MPELPEVETIRRDLVREIGGQILEKLQVKERVHLLRNCSEKILKETLIGKRLEKIDRRGKYLLFCFGKQIMLLHLRMSGRLLLKPANHTRLILQFSDKKTIYFDDARRFGSLHLTHKDQLEELPSMQVLGLEPLSAAYSLKKFSSKLNSKQEIKRWLLDQKRVVGVGNIYASEALFEAKIAPERQADSLSPNEVKRLHKAIPKVLNKAIESGGTSIDSYRTPSGELGNFQNEFSVYEREEQPCHRCKSKISRIVQGGRSTYFCPSCQS